MSMGLGVGLAAYLIFAFRREPRLRKGASLLLALIVAEIAVGAAVLGSARSVSFISAALAHEVGAIVLLAAVIAIAPTLIVSRKAGEGREGEAAAPSRREGA
jgi:heme A synthase